MSEVLTSCAQPSDGMPRRRLNRATARHNGLVNKPSNPQKQPWNAHSKTSVPETQTLARSAPDKHGLPDKFRAITPCPITRLPGLPERVTPPQMSHALPSFP